MVCTVYRNVVNWSNIFERKKVLALFVPSAIVIAYFCGLYIFDGVLTSCLHKYLCVVVSLKMAEHCRNM